MLNIEQKLEKIPYLYLVSSNGSLHLIDLGNALLAAEYCRSFNAVHLNEQTSVEHIALALVIARNMQDNSAIAYLEYLLEGVLLYQNA